MSTRTYLGIVKEVLENLGTWLTGLQCPPQLFSGLLAPSQVEVVLSGLDTLETVARMLLAFTTVARRLLNIAVPPKT